jgi:hypothetical protein
VEPLSGSLAILLRFRLANDEPTIVSPPSHKSFRPFEFALTAVGQLEGLGTDIVSKLFS